MSSACRSLQYFPVSIADGTVTGVVVVVDEVTVVEDATEALRQRRLDEDRRNALQRLEIMRELGTDLLTARTPEMVGAVTVERASSLVPCQHVSVSTILDNGPSGFVLAVVPGEGRALHPGTPFELIEGPTLARLRGGETFAQHVDESPLLDDVRESLVAEGVSAYIVAPLIVDDVLVGTLTFGFAAGEDIRPEHLESARQIAAPVALALRDVSLRAALEESERRFRTLADSTSVMIWVGDEQGRDVFNNRGWLDFRGNDSRDRVRASVAR